MAKNTTPSPKAPKQPHTPVVKQALTKAQDAMYAGTNLDPVNTRKYNKFCARWNPTH